MTLKNMTDELLTRHKALGASIEAMMRVQAMIEHLQEGGIDCAVVFPEPGVVSITITVPGFSQGLTPDPEPETEPVQANAPSPEYVTGKWSDDDCAQALDLAAAGKSTHEIAAALNRNPMGVGTMVARLVKAADEPNDETPAPPKVPDPDPVAAPPSTGAQGGVGHVPYPNLEPAPLRTTQTGRLCTIAGNWTAAEMANHLDALGYPDLWSSKADLILFTGYGRGDSADQIAARLKFQIDEVKARRKALLPRDACTIANQTKMLTMLRERAGE